MSFKLITAKLTGNPTLSGLVQVHDVVSPDFKKPARGRLFIVVTTCQETQGGSADLAKRAIDMLQDQYYSSNSQSILKSLSDTLEKVYFNLLTADRELGLAALVSFDNIVYAAVAGGAKVVLFREGKLVTILTGKSGGCTSASGFIKNQDVLVCGTQEFFSFFNDAVLTSALQSNSPESMVEVLAPSIHTGNGGGRIGAFILKTVESTNVSEADDVFVPQENELSRTGGRDSYYAAPQEENDAVAEAAAQSFASSQPLRFSQGERNTIDNSDKFPLLPKRSISLKAVNFLKRSIKIASVDETPHTASRKRTYAILGAIFILLLALSTIIGIRQKNLRDEKETYLSRLNQAVHGLEESVKLYQLDAKRSRELFVASRETVASLEAEGITDPALGELKSKLAQNEGAVLGEFTGGTEVFLNLSLLSSGFEGDILSATTKRMYVLDKDAKRVVAISFETKRSEVVAGPSQIREAKGLTAFADSAFVHQDDGIYKVGNDAVKAIENEWTGEVITSAYLGNLYVVEKAMGRIWRYPATASGFGNRQSWLLDGVEPDFTNIKNIVIDGSIWLLSGSGQIFKYTSGYQRDFRITGLFPDLNNPAGIYTNEDLEFLYVLDSENSRVVVLDKSGEFKYQYLADEAKEAQGLAVSEKDKKIILLVGEKLMSIEIRH
jgi:hypothetical protein